MGFSPINGSRSQSCTWEGTHQPELARGSAIAIKWLLIAWEISPQGSQRSLDFAASYMVRFSKARVRSCIQFCVSYCDLWSQKWCYLCCRVLPFGVTLRYVEEDKGCLYSVGSTVLQALSQSWYLQAHLGLGVIVRSLLQAVFLYVEFPLRAPVLFWSLISVGCFSPSEILLHLQTSERVLVLFFPEKVSSLPRKGYLQIQTFKKERSTT